MRLIKEMFIYFVVRVSILNVVNVVSNLDSRYLHGRIIVGGFLFMMAALLTKIPIDV